MMKKHFLLIPAMLILSACANVRYDTGSKPDMNARSSRHQVQEYSNLEIARLNAEFLRPVYASSCTSQSLDTIVRALKKNTYAVGGNGLVVEDCYNKVVPGCDKFIECQGSAYDVPESSDTSRF